MNVELTPEQERLVREQLATGNFKTASDLLDYALWNVAEEQQSHHSIEEIQAKIRRGVEQADRGELLDISIMDIAAEARRRRQSQ
jgi:Arc/MetJ-type ribon-helix-helix transcriptional regulator